jgi:hypothetical protein
VTLYLTPDGSDIVVCDRCGIAHDDTCPRLANLKPFDPEDGLRLSLRSGERGRKREKDEHYCPECAPKAKLEGAVLIPWP